MSGNRLIKNKEFIRGILHIKKLFHFKVSTELICGPTINKPPTRQMLSEFNSYSAPKILNALGK